MDYSLKYAFKSLDELTEDVELKHQKELKENLQESKSTIQENLEEGYLGQTVRDFLDVCVDPSTIGKIQIADNDADDFTVVYEGNFDDLPEYILEASFDDFDCGDGKIVLNCDPEGEGGEYYETVADFIDDCNTDEVEIQVNGKVVFSGDKYDIPEDILEYGIDTFDAPEFICINAREIEETNESLKEAYSEKIPEWFKKGLSRKNNLKNKLNNRGFDLNKLEVVEAEVPESAYDINLKDDTKTPVFELNTSHYNNDYELYIKGINDDDSYYDENWHLKYFGKTPIKQLAQMTNHFGYITTDPSNYNRELRKQRKEEKDGMVTRGKGQWRREKEIFNPDTMSYKKTGEYEWVEPKSGEDKSGYLSKAEELKARLYQADLTNYEEKLNKLESRIESIRKALVEATNNLNLRDKTQKGGWNSDKGANYIKKLGDHFEDIMDKWFDLLERIDGAINRYSEDKDKLSDEINNLFNNSWVRTSLEKAEAYIKDYGVKEELEENFVNLREEEEVEKEKEKIEKEKDETPIEQIVDPSATIVDELKPSYVGYAVLHCEACKTPMYKKPEELTREERVNPDTGKTEYVYCTGLECTHCGSTGGYELIGQIATMDAGEEKPVEETTKEEVVEEEPEPTTDLPELENSVEETVEEKSEEVKESLIDFDEQSFDNHINKYLKEVYENVDSYKSTDGFIEYNTIIIEGLVKFATGKEAKTSFKLTLNGTKITGLNESFAKKENSYSIEGKIENNTFITESITYKYNIGDDLVEGCTKEPLQEETNMDKIMKVLDSDKVEEQLKEPEETTNEKVEEEVVEESKSNHKFEVLWFEGLTEEEAKRGDPISKTFTSKKDALDYYELTKDDEGKFGFMINEWDEKGELVDDIL